ELPEPLRLRREESGIGVKPVFQEASAGGHLDTHRRMDAPSAHSGHGFKGAETSFHLTAHHVGDHQTGSPASARRWSRNAAEERSTMSWTVSNPSGPP